MPRRSSILAAVFFLAGCRHCPTTPLNGPPAPASAIFSGAAPAGPARLKILTWNVWMMPWFTFQSPENKKRAGVIADELLKLDADILCLEKVFDGGAHKVLSKALKARFPFQYGPANSKFSIKVNSGVWVASRFPLSEYHEIQFRDCAGVECFSRKGAMLLTGSFHGHPFQILATHLQGEEGASYTAAHQQIRDRQMTQIRDELLTPFAKPGVPLFLCGDFDTPRRDPTEPPGNPLKESDGYRFILQTFGNPQNHSGYLITLDDSCAHNDLATDNSGRTDELDYVLVKPNGTNLAPAWSRVILLHPGWDGRTTRKNLSYRYAMSAAIEFQ